MSANERWYYLERARQALELSKKATDAAISGIHLEMHERYLEQADEFAPHVPGRGRLAANQP